MKGMRTFSAFKSTIKVYWESASFSPFAPRIARAVFTALLFTKKKNKSLNIYLLNDFSMSRINILFRGKKGPTNVLSFESSKDPRFSEKKAPKDTSYIGEIYLAPKFICRKKEDISFLSVHAVLHLLGYDHMKESEAKKMEITEKKIMELFKAGD